MRTKLFALFVCAAAALACSSKSYAAPLVSACTVNNSGAGPGITCNLYESENGESSNLVSLPQPPGGGAAAGYVVLLEGGNPNDTANQNNVANWSDVVVFLNAAGAPTGTATTAQLVSDGSGLFPSLATVLGSTHAFILETQTGTGNDNTDVTVYSPAPNTYNIFSDSPAKENDLPEPASISLLAAGLLGIGVFAGKFRN